MAPLSLLDPRDEVPVLDPARFHHTTLIERQKVGLFPGTIFGELGGHLRISFSIGEDKLKEPLARFGRLIIGKS